MKCTILLLFLIFLTKTSYSQSDEFRDQRVQFTVFNIGFNGLVGGVGGLINKDPSKTGFQAFSKGFYQGAIGGAVSHVGLSLTHQIQVQKSIAYAWPARLVNSVGSSIIQNSAEGRRMFERLHLNLYFIRFDYYTYQKKFTGRLFTSSIYGILSVGNNARFDLGKSLKSGILYFESDQNFPISAGNFSSFAIAQVSSIGMSTTIAPRDFYDVYAEETAHILQYDRKVGGNAFLFNTNKRLMEKNSTYNFLSKYIYLDLNGPIFWLGYRLEGQPHSCNFFEQEAINYSYRSAYKCQ